MEGINQHLIPERLDLWTRRCTNLTTREIEADAHRAYGTVVAGGVRSQKHSRIVLSPVSVKISDITEVARSRGDYQEVYDTGEWIAPFMNKATPNLTR